MQMTPWIPSIVMCAVAGGVCLGQTVVSSAPTGPSGQTAQKIGIHTRRNFVRLENALLAGDVGGAMFARNSPCGGNWGVRLRALANLMGFPALAPRMTFDIRTLWMNSD